MLTPLQTARRFGPDVWRLSAIEIAFSAGMAAGGVLISLWGGLRNKIYMMALACFSFGITTFLFGVVPDFRVYLGLMVLCGITMPVYNTPASAMMQSKLDPAVMGRVFSVLMVIHGLAFPVGMAIFGPLGDVVRIEALLMVTGAALFLGGFALLGSRSLRTAGE